MHSSLLLAAIASALRAAADVYPDYEYGNDFYLGPPFDTAKYITKATYSLLPPSPPTDYLTSNKDDRWLSLWIGLQDNSNDVLNENFVQPLLNWAPNQELQGCSADVDHWCAGASTYTPSGQIGQTYVPVPSDTTLDFEVYIDDSNNITQVISMAGSVISKQSDSNGMKPQLFYSGTECYDDGCGTLDAFSWTNITITFNEAAPRFDQTLTLTGATSSGMKTTNGGKTWTIASITIDKQDLTES